MLDTNAQLIGRLEAKVELLLKEAEDAKSERQEQSKRLAKIEQEFASLKTGVRWVLSVAAIMGGLIGFTTNWIWKIWQAG